MFKNHLEMIGRNEAPSKKAKFWQSFVRSLKGSEDIRAHETPKSWRPYSAYVDAPINFRSIFDEPHTPGERISSHGYRYQPVHREIYGYSPRPIYDHHYRRSVPPASYDVDRAWSEHLKRMADIERRYPSRYGLYLKDKPNSLVPLEYEPEDKPLISDRSSRSRSISPYRNVGRSSSLPPWSEDFLPSQIEPFMRHRSPRARSVSPTPIKPGLWAPRFSEVAYDTEGSPVYPSFRRNHLNDMLNVRPSLPISAITKDPWWWNTEELRPFRAHIPNRDLPWFLRDSYLSPVKRTYLWYRHPARPYAHIL